MDIKHGCYDKVPMHMTALPILTVKPTQLINILNA